MMQNLIKIIWRNVDRKTKLYFFLLLLGMVLASISEAASISIALPYIAVLINPENAIKSLGNSNLFNWLLFDKSDIFFNLTIIFCVAVTLSGFLRIVVMQMATNFSFKTGEILSNKAYKSIVEADYEFLISKNSGELINLASIKPDNLIYGFITPCLTLCSSLAFSIFIVLVLCYVNIWMTLGSILFFCILYALIIKQNKKNLIQISLSISEIRDNLVRLVQHTVGGIRDIIINNMSVNYIKEYEKENALIRSSQAKSIIIGTSPRYYVETISLFFLAIVGYIIISREGSAEYISIVAVFALAAQKLLPLAQQSYNSWSTIKTNYDSALDVLSAFSYPKEEVAEEKNRIPFREKVDLSNTSISLSGKKIIRNFSLTINKGEKIGLVGESGSGKTTLIDFMMGLTTCDDGIFSVDGSQISDEERVLWRRQTSHVPQNVFLFNQSILLNVVLGDTSPNLNFAYECLALAQLKEFVMNLPNGINTVVGDGGLQISGGQRQRIGIARALYKGSDILFLDEATSALDSNTELSIMKSLYALDKVTMIIVAHRENTLAGCNRIVHVG